MIQGINAACRTFKTTKKSIKRWSERLGSLKGTLLLYALCEQFLPLLIEGDELYTKVGKNKLPSESEGWTIVLMDRASRFIWELSCGEKESALFENAMATLLQVIKETDALSLVTDGERRYGNLLFEICQEVIRTGQVGRPKTTLKEGVKVRVKNKGSQSYKKGPKHSKYQAPQPELPIRYQTLKMNRFIPIMWKLLTVLYDVECLLIVGKSNTYSEIPIFVLLFKHRFLFFKKINLINWRKFIV